MWKSEPNSTRPVSEQCRFSRVTINGIRKTIQVVLCSCYIRLVNCVHCVVGCRGRLDCWRSTRRFQRRYRFFEVLLYDERIGWFDTLVVVGLLLNNVEAKLLVECYRVFVRDLHVTVSNEVNKDFTTSAGHRSLQQAAIQSKVLSLMHSCPTSQSSNYDCYCINDLLLRRVNTAATRKKIPIRHSFNFCQIQACGIDGMH